MPAEGLLGAARLAHSLRSGPPSLRSGVQRRCATFRYMACRTRLILLSGVRIVRDHRHLRRCIIAATDGDMPAEGLLGAARLAHSLRSGPPSLRSGVHVAARRSVTRRVEPGLFFCRGVRIVRDHRHLRRCIIAATDGDMPAEGFE